MTARQIRSRVVDTLSGCGRWALLSLIGAFLILGFARDGYAQERQVPPAFSQSPVHSTVDVSKLPMPRSPATTGVEVKPLRTRDPQELERWKESIRQSPDALPPAPGFVRDGRSDR